MLALLCLIATSAFAQDPFADAVASFVPGTNAGFGADELPGIVLGPPQGSGLLQGSFHTVSLGNGGVIVMRFDLPMICDGPGVDFTIFENAFHAGSTSGPIFTDYGIVAVSQDGETFVDIAYDATSHVGLAGQSPVLSHPDNDIDPLDPAVSGGDQFDLADVGLAWISYVRITDPATAIPDIGNMIPQADNSGFDLDAIAALHACDPSTLASATPSFTPSPTRPAATPSATAPVGATATATAVDAATPTATASGAATPSATVGSATPSATATGIAVLPGDIDGNGSVTAADAALLIAELYDGDGDAAAPGDPADVNEDGSITAADVAALAALRTQ